jgi:uncharacterized protein with GYD domain
MPKYLAVASYNSEGIKDLVKAGGTARRRAVEKLLKGIGGRLETFYFAFGENDAYLILDVPEGRTAAAISMAVAGCGAARIKTIALLMPEDIDEAVKKPIHFETLN